MGVLFIVPRFFLVFVPLVLLLLNVVEMFPIVDPGIWPVIRPEGLCHIIDGSTDYAFS